MPFNMGRAIPEGEYVVHHPLGVGSPVDIVAYEDEPVPGGLPRDFFYEPVEHVQAPVNVSYHESSTGINLHYLTIDSPINHCQQ